MVSQQGFERCEVWADWLGVLFYANPLEIRFIANPRCVAALDRNDLAALTNGLIALFDHMVELEVFINGFGLLEVE